MLQRYGVAARKVRRGDDVVVEVHFGQGNLARTVLRERERALRIDRRSNRPYAMFVGAFIAALVCVVPAVVVVGGSVLFVEAGRKAWVDDNVFLLGIVAGVLCCMPLGAFFGWLRECKRYG